MKANKKVSDKTLVIIILVTLIILMIFLPFGKIIVRPSISGAIITRVFVKPLELDNTCSLSLIAGWDIISIACVPNNTSVAYVLSSINGNYTSIHAYDTLETIDYWKSYNPNMPSWVIQDLSEINNKKGYWMRINNNSVLSITGVIPTPYEIALVRGWNLIGYPSASSKTPSNAFSSIDGSYSIVWTYNTSIDSYLYYNPNLGAGTLEVITNDLGYWINMTKDDSLWLT